MLFLLTSKGKYQDLLGSSLCKDCSIGKAIATAFADTTCDDCTAGKYQNEIGKEACKSCDSGKYYSKIKAADLADGSYCFYCLAGKKIESDKDTGVFECNDCELGTYQNEDGTKGNVKTTCKKCGEFFFLFFFSQIFCEHLF